MKNYLNQSAMTLGVYIFLNGLKSRASFVFIFIFSLLCSFNCMLSLVAVGNQDRVILNGGFWLLGILGVFVAIFFCSNLINQEIKTKNIYLFLSRPVSRKSYYSGCLLGLFFNSLFIFSCCLLIFTIVLFFFTEFSLNYELIITLLFIYIEWLLLLSLGLMFSSFTSPLLNSFFIACIYFIGHFSRSLYIYSENSKDVFLKKILLIVYYVFPNLEALNFRKEVLYAQSIDLTTILLGFSTSFFWGGTAFFCGYFIFRSKKII